MTTPQLVWFKRDLRIKDHQPLFEAASRGATLCVYIYEPNLLLAPDVDAAHVEFINQSLVELRASLRSLGGQLILRRGDAVSVLNQLCSDYQVKQIWAHEETTNQLGYQRDRQVRAWAKSTGITLNELPQTGVIRRLANRDGWSKIWNQRMYAPACPAPQSLASPTCEDPGNILSAAELGVPAISRESVQVGGETAARKCLQDFLEGRGLNYRSGMSSPSSAIVSCSRLSPYLAYGNISMRTVLQATVQRNDQLKQEPRTAEISRWRQSLTSFQGRLRWHCHFIQKMEDEPSIEFRNINSAYDGLREGQFNESYFAAWCAGQTGYPLVDACMRALHKTGWINFRMRAMLVSFATQHLWLHWPRPALYLARLFLDYEPGIHYSQTQMQAGVTGINTVRIYSPIKQVKDQDPHGVFIRQYVPELEGVPDRLLAEPHRMTIMEQSLYGCKIGVDYPAPIVDHDTAYRAARERIYSVKRSVAAKAEAAEILEKHGSRRSPSRRSPSSRAGRVSSKKRKGDN